MKCIKTIKKTNSREIGEIIRIEENEAENKVKTGLTIFYTTHILSEAEYLCDEIAIIDKGKILTVDTPDALKKRFGKEKTIKIHLIEILRFLRFLILAFSIKLILLIIIPIC